MTFTAAAAAARSADPDRFVRRRLGWVWALLVLNVLPYGKGAIINLPTTAGKILTQGALWLALVLVLTVNRRFVRLNGYLIVGSLLGLVSLVVSIHVFHFGTVYRSVRLIGFLAVLWLLTPWFGRRDRMLLRFHLRCLMGILIVSAVAIPLAPHKAFVSGRFTGAFWPIPAPQLAHYAAVAAGLVVVLWLCRLLRWQVALAMTLFSVLALILTHTRTALVAFIVGVALAAASLFLARRRIRRVIGVVAVVAALGGLVAAPAISHWFLRGENTALFTNLTGRTVVWHDVVNAPRDKEQMVFGAGLSNASFNGLSIDSSWLSIYQEQGLLGDVLVGIYLVILAVALLVRARGPSLALGLFLLGYCLVASYTEVGLGDASTYLLDLAVAASLVPLPGLTRIRALPAAA